MKCLRCGRPLKTIIDGVLLGPKCKKILAQEREVAFQARQLELLESPLTRKLRAALALFTRRNPHEVHSL